jgi:6-phosphogluconolactonase
VDPARQKGPHAHCATFDPDGHVVFVCDLGLDKVFAYRVDSTKGSLSPNDPPSTPVAPGSGPRHIAFLPNGKSSYVINEMGATITVFSRDAKRSALKEIQTLPTLPPDFSGRKSCAEIAVHPSGKFVYGSNRGHDTIAVYSVDDSSGKLTSGAFVPCGGKEPRNFAIDPTGAFLFVANQNSENIATFRIDNKTGNLTRIEGDIEVGKPVCIVFVPAG